MASDGKPIRVLIACPKEMLDWEAVKKVPGGERIEVVGRALDEAQVENYTQHLSPHIVLLDADHASYDAFALASQLTLRYTDIAVIIISADQSLDQIRRAMLAGAEDYWTAPLQLEEAVSGLLNVAALMAEKERARTARPSLVARAGELIAVVSGKGGVGKTTIATNLALAISQGMEKRVALVGLENGDAAVLLSIAPSVGLTDLFAVVDELDGQVIQPYITTHKSGLSVVVSLGTNDFSEVRPLQNPRMGDILNVLRQEHDYVLVDLPPVLYRDDLQVLGWMDQILLVTSSWDLLVVRNTKALLEILPPEMVERVKVVLNRADRNDMIQESQIAKSLNHPIACQIQNDSRLAPTAINLGTPFVASHPQSQIAQDIFYLARVVVGAEGAEKREEKRRKFLFFG